MLLLQAAAPLLTAPCLQAYSEWASNAIQLDRTGQAAHAPATLSKTSGAIRRMLGFKLNVLEQAGPPVLQDMLNGDLLAAYTAFALDIRCALAPSHLPTGFLTRNRCQAQQAQLSCH